jgi:hypothetical protein
MFRLLPVLSAIPLLLAFGVAEGLWTDRWSLSPQLARAPERLAQLPRVVGPWQGDDQELDPRQVRQADLRAHLMRRYVHRDSGEALTVLLVCGRPGPIAVHSPEVCYGGAGFVPAGPRTRHAVQAEGLSGPAEFWAERYSRRGAAVPEHLQLYYGWNASGGWSAAEKPRLAFARARALYKLYVVRRLPRPDEPAEQDPIPAFLRLFLPQADRSLFSTP